MADWITHIMVVWIVCMVLGFKFKQINMPNIVICMIGALIPDIMKIYILFNYFNIYIGNLILALHTPFGSFLVVSIISLFFKEKKFVLSLLILGFVTHYILDILLIDIYDGVYLFYPLSWNFYHFGVYSNTDVLVTISFVVSAIVIHLITLKINRRNV